MTALLLILWLACLGGAAQDNWDDLGKLEAGSERGRRVAELLEQSNETLAASAQQLAFEAGARAADHFELDLALRIQATLHQRVQASWSAFNWALSLQKAGQIKAADRIYSDLLTRAKRAEQADLWGQRGILALGAGNAISGRAYLGRALALGSLDAAAVLARESFARHNLNRAKNGFRSVLARNQTHPWALRGWGLSLLPASRP